MLLYMLNSALMSNMKTSSTNSPSAPPGTAQFYCGTTFIAALDCHRSCPTGDSAVCQSGESCFAGVTCNAPGNMKIFTVSYPSAEKGGLFEVFMSRRPARVRVTNTWK